MRYMRWSYADLEACPVDYLSAIGELARAEMQAQKMATTPQRRGRR